MHPSLTRQPSTPLRQPTSPSSRDELLSPTLSPMTPSPASQPGDDEPLSPASRTGCAPKAHKHLQQVQAGDGKKRAGLLEHAPGDNPARRIGKSLAHLALGVLAIPAALIGYGLGSAAFGAAVGVGLGAAAVVGTLRALCFIGRQLSERVLEPRAERQFRAMNQPWITALGRPVAGGTVANPAVQARLHAHATQVGSPLSRDEIVQLAATGERLVRALDQGAASEGGQLTVDGHAVPSSLYTTRAISWYLMARAADKDLALEAARPGQKAGADFPSAMIEEGSFRFQDPGNRLFNFMRAAPTAGYRAATHFEERVQDPEKFRLMGKKKIKHWGLDDYTGQLPGKRGAILFNKLVPSVDGGPPEMYIKFERVGCPRLTAVEPHQGALHKLMRAPAALDRFLMHGMHYGEGLVRHKPHREGVVTGPEHAYKGRLKATIHDPLMAIVRDAVDAGLVRASAKGIAKSVKKEGLPAVKRTLNDLEAVLVGNKAYTDRIQSLRKTIADHEATAAGGLPMLPRGAEGLVAMFDQSLRPGGAVDELQADDFSSDGELSSESDDSTASDADAPQGPRLVQASRAERLDADELAVDIDFLR